MLGEWGSGFGNVSVVSQGYGDGGLSVWGAGSKGMGRGAVGQCPYHDMASWHTEG